MYCNLIQININSTVNTFTITAPIILMNCTYRKILSAMIVFDDAKFELSISKNIFSSNSVSTFHNYQTKSLIDLKFAEKKI